MWPRLLLVLICLATDTIPIHSAGIFKKSPKPDPVQRVPVLLNTLKSDMDEKKRAEAASELRDYDVKQFPDIMQGLIDALTNDSSSSVRVEAANAISKLRPISQQAGFALEQALQNDSSMRVRMAARTTLWQYYLLGYRSGKSPVKGPQETEEPPLAIFPEKTKPAPNRPAPSEQPEQPLGPRIESSKTPRSLFQFWKRDKSAPPPVTTALESQTKTPDLVIPPPEPTPDWSNPLPIRTNLEDGPSLGTPPKIRPEK